MGPADADMVVLTVGVMEVGAYDIPVRLSRNTLWFTARSGCHWPPPPQGIPLPLPDSPPSPCDHDMDLDSAEAMGSDVGTGADGHSSDTDSSAMDGTASRPVLLESSPEAVRHSPRTIHASSSDDGHASDRDAPAHDDTSEYTLTPDGTELLRSSDLGIDRRGFVRMMSQASEPPTPRVETPAQGGDDLRPSQIARFWQELEDDPMGTGDFLHRYSQTPTRGGEPEVLDGRRSLEELPVPQDAGHEGSRPRGSAEALSPSAHAAVVDEQAGPLVPVLATQWVAQEKATIPDKARDRRNLPSAADSDKNFMDFWNKCLPVCERLTAHRPVAPNVGSAS